MNNSHSTDTTESSFKCDELKAASILERANDGKADKLKDCIIILVLAVSLPVCFGLTRAAQCNAYTDYRRTTAKMQFQSKDN